MVEQEEDDDECISQESKDLKAFLKENPSAIFDVVAIYAEEMAKNSEEFVKELKKMNYKPIDSLSNTYEDWTNPVKE